MFCSRDDRGSAILISLLVGGMVGAAIALLMAPQSGRETREDIADLAGDVTDSVGGYAKKVRETLT